MVEKFTSPRGIAELNIEHYTRLLGTDLDAERRRAVETLLKQEREKLAALAARGPDAGSN